MKKTILLCFITMLISQCVIAQSGDPKVDALLKQMQKESNGKITYTLNGKKISEGILVTKVEGKKMYLLIGDPIKTNTTIACSFPLQSGSYSFSGNNDWFLGVGNTPYSIQGTATISISGNKITGTFTGDVYAPDGKGKFSKKSSGKVSGSFSASL